MPIRAVGFDLDDTLYSRKDFYEKVFNVMQSSVLNINENFNEFYKVFQVCSDVEYEKFMRREKTRDEYKNDRVIASYNKFGASVSVNEAIIFNSLYLYFADTIVYRKDVEPLLQFLKNENIELFVLTNGPSRDQRRKLEQLEIENYIPKNNWFISDELDFTKPDYKIFQFVENSLELNGKEILYVGDDLDNDIIGSKKSNWQTFFLNIHGVSSIPVETEIAHSFEEIIEKIKLKIL